MNVALGLLSASGRLAYLICLPVLRIYLRKTKRAYVAIKCGEEILVIKNWLGRGGWQLPGGGIKSYESPKLGAIREVWEEVGIELAPDDLKIITSGKWESDNLGHFYIIFEASLSEKPRHLMLSQPEVIAAEWLPVSEIQKNTSAEIKTALKTSG